MVTNASHACTKYNIFFYYILIIARFDKEKKGQNESLEKFFYCLILETRT